MESKKIKEKSYERPTDEEIREKLSDMEYYVTQQGGTERPFTSVECDNFERGIYVDIVTGEPLFSSKYKFESGCGWPSFAKPIGDGVLIENLDRSHGMIRTEVRSKIGDSHLGHVFSDGPRELGGLRYCINGVAVRFIAEKDMAKEGYAKYINMLD